MNEGQSRISRGRKALTFALAAILPLLGTAALGQDRMFGLDVERTEQEAILAPQPNAAAQGSEDMASGTTIPPRDISGGVASWYGAQFDGKRTASGERFDPDELTAAHRTLPFGSRVRVKYARTGKSVVVRINDRGPFGHGRVIDLSQAAAREIGLAQAGSGRVELALLDR